MIEFENLYQKELLELDEIINLNIDLFSSICKNNEELVKTNIEFIFLILRSVDYYISAIYLLKQRAFFESLSIARQSIESAAVTVHIQGNPKIYEKFKALKYDSTSAIKYTTKLIQGLGRLWGNLSNVGVHPNSIQGVSQKSNVINFCSSPFLNPGEAKYSPELDQYMILTLKISGNVIYRCFEILTSDFSKKDQANEIQNECLNYTNRNTAEILDELLKDYSFYRH